MSKLILTQEVTGLGSPGDVVEVKGGYARNWLVPSGFAVPWTRGAQKQVDQIRASRNARAAQSHDDALAQKARLESAPVRVSVRTGQAGRLFGSVSSADVAAAVQSAGLGTVDRRDIELPAAIRSVGSYDAVVRLHDDVTASIAVEVVAAR